MTRWTHREISRYHRRAGLLLTVPLLAWIVSSQMLHYVGMTAPNGLQGVYRLNPRNSLEASLGDVPVAPSEILSRLRHEHSLHTIHWLRLEAFADRLLYLVKPTPFSPGMTFDAVSGERLDPLSHELLLKIAGEKLEGTQPAGIEEANHEFHRDYSDEVVPAAAIQMRGSQPSTLILSRATGRTLRRIDSDAARFGWWYHTFHVYQWGPQIWIFTGLLFSVAIFALLQTATGARLLWLRRHRQKGNSPRQRAFQLHRAFAMATILFLAAQMPIGAYMWLNLGPFQGSFRGKGTFNLDWNHGIPTDARLPAPREVIALVSPQMDLSEGPIQWIEWRDRLGQPVAVVSSRRDAVGRVFSTTGEQLGPLAPEQAGLIAGQQVAGQPGFRFVQETEYYWNDLNRRIPAYHFRFEDDRSSDIFVGATSGEIIARRTDFWRAFGPFLRLHAFAWTQNRIVDTVLLIVFQLGLVGLIASGWRLHFVLSRPASGSRQATRPSA